jgi:hypothetical protein
MKLKKPFSTDNYKQRQPRAVSEGKVFGSSINSTAFLRLMDNTLAVSNN